MEVIYSIDDPRLVVGAVLLLFESEDISNPEDYRLKIEITSIDVVGGVLRFSVLNGGWDGVLDVSTRIITMDYKNSQVDYSRSPLVYHSPPKILSSTIDFDDFDDDVPF